MKYIMIIAAFLLTLVIGYMAAETKRSNSTAEAFFRGDVSFCDLSIEEKIRVCPKMRIYDRKLSGGAVTMYYCNSKSAFIVLENATSKTRQEAMAMLNGFEIIPACKNSNEESMFITKKKDSALNI